MNQQKQTTFCIATHQTQPLTPPFVHDHVNQRHRLLHAILDSIYPTMIVVPVVRPSPKNSIVCRKYRFGQYSGQPLL